MYKTLMRDIGRPLEVSSHHLARLMLQQADMPVIVDGLGGDAPIVELAVGEQGYPMNTHPVFVIEVRLPKED